MENIENTVEISIIVPVYNVEKYIKRCINSILQQSFNNYELILIDDGSTDLSAEICEDYAKRYSFILCIHTINQGQAVARNIGIKVARGEYIAFVDADDYIAYNYLEELYQIIKEKNSDIAVCDFYVVNSEGKIIYDRYKKQNISNEIVWNTCGKNQKVDLLFSQKVMNYMWNKLYKSKLFDEIIFPYGRRYEDIAIMYKLFDIAGQIACSTKKLYYYVNNPVGTTNKCIDVDIKSISLVCNEIEKYFSNFDREKPAFMEEYLCTLLVANYINGLKLHLDKDLLKNMKDNYMRLCKSNSLFVNLKNPYWYKLIFMKLNILERLYKHEYFE